MKQCTVQNENDTVPRRILLAARELFMKQGYKHTTIRQIIERSGVQTGSIYHFYKNKDDIVQAVIFLVMERSTALMSICFADEVPGFRYAAVIVVWMKAIERSPFIKEMYSAAYTSDTIFEQMVEYVTDLLARIFRDKTPEYTREDYYLRVLLLKGAMRSCIVRLSFKKDTSSKECYTILITMTLPMFGFTEKEIQDILTQIADRDKNLTGITDKLITESIIA